MHRRPGDPSGATGPSKHSRRQVMQTEAQSPGGLKQMEVPNGTIRSRSWTGRFSAGRSLRTFPARSELDPPDRHRPPRVRDQCRATDFVVPGPAAHSDPDDRRADRARRLRLQNSGVALDGNVTIANCGQLQPAAARWQSTYRPRHDPQGLRRSLKTSSSRSSTKVQVALRSAGITQSIV